jgi:hypothetical protein
MKRKPKFDPALPLRNVRHEAFARARVVLETPLQAMQHAGYEKPTTGNAARLDRHPNIIARVGHLSACDNDLAMVTLRRNRIRNMLERIALVDRTRLVENAEEPIIFEGKPVIVDGKALTRKVQRLRAFPEMTEDERLLIEIDGDKVKTVFRLDAVAQLRKLDGLDRPEKVAITDPSGNQPAVLSEGDAQGDITQTLGRLLGIADRKLVMELQGLLGATSDKAGGG